MSSCEMTFSMFNLVSYLFGVCSYNFVKFTKKQKNNKKKYITTTKMETRGCVNNASTPMEQNPYMVCSFIFNDFILHSRYGL